MIGGYHLFRPGLRTSNGYAGKPAVTTSIPVSRTSIVAGKSMFLGPIGSVVADTLPIGGGPAALRLNASLLICGW
jgi:hypothetical protein